MELNKHEKGELAEAIKKIRGTLDTLEELKDHECLDTEEEVVYQIGQLHDNIELFKQLSTRVLLREEEIEENEDDEGIGEKV